MENRNERGGGRFRKGWEVGVLKGREGGMRKIIGIYWGRRATYIEGRELRA